MTPSEIAAWHDGAAAWMESREDFHIQAAATIRNLEAKNKIATEALEEVRDGASEVALIAIADQALTRIEELT